MSIFFIGDFLVGLNLSTDPGIKKMIFESLIWMFYAPALLFLAFSGYKLEAGGTEVTV